MSRGNVNERVSFSLVSNFWGQTGGQSSASTAATRRLSPIRLLRLYNQRERKNSFRRNAYYAQTCKKKKKKSSPLNRSPRFAGIWPTNEANLFLFVDSALARFSSRARDGRQGGKFPSKSRLLVKITYPRPPKNGLQPS